MNLFTWSMLFYYFGKYLQMKNHKKILGKNSKSKQVKMIYVVIFLISIYYLFRPIRYKELLDFKEKVSYLVFLTIDNRTEKRAELQLKMQLNQVSSQILVAKLRNQCYEDGV